MLYVDGFNFTEAEWHMNASLNLTNIGSDNGSSPDRHRVIILTNPGILLTGPWATTFDEILIKIQEFW